tara:strand:- start:2020 stop:2646 length:627 start_codon:yes stop_codon:yes gene_type:complete
MKAKKHFFISQDNFLDPDLIRDIDNYVNDSHKDPIWRTSHWWKKPIRRVTPPVAILNLPDKFHFAIIEKLKKIKQISWKSNEQPFQSQYYLYPPGGYIAWHDDNKYKWASTLYVNPVWDPNWGGIHLHEDLKGLGIRGEAPAFNKCIINSGGVPHSVSVLAPDAPLRRVISTFGPLTPHSEGARKKWEDWKRKRSVGAVYFEGSYDNQ